MDGSRFNRRRLVKRTAQAGMTMGMASTLSLLRPPPASASTLIAKGFNDDFMNYCKHPSLLPALTLRLLASNATTIRVGFQWSSFQPQVSDLTKPFNDWSNLGGLASLKMLAASANVKILPVFASLPIYARSSTGGCRPEYLDSWGRFAAEIARDLNQAGLLEAVEIGNEPNTFEDPDDGGNLPGESDQQYRARKNPWCMTCSELGDLITYAYVWIERFRDEGLINSPVRIISGGLFAKTQGSPTPYPNGLPQGPLPTGTELTWKQYLTKFQERTCAEYVVGFHPYDLGPYDMQAGYPETPRGSAISGNVCNLFDQAAALTPRDIWVTETGATSRENGTGPVTETAQADALYHIALGLAWRSRCKAMIVHRLYDSSVVGSEPANTTYYRFGVFRDTESPPANMPNKVLVPKASFSTLSNIWSGL